jgi:hypothetical protein
MSFWSCASEQVGIHEKVDKASLIYTDKNSQPFLLPRPWKKNDGLAFLKG